MIFRIDIKIDEYIRYDPKFRYLHRSSKVYGVLMYGRVIVSVIKRTLTF